MSSTTSARPETHRICNVRPPRDHQRDLVRDWRIEDALSAGVVAQPSALPASVDLRASWWNIGDQQNTGSCVGWASTDGVMRYHMVHANRLAQTGHLSPRFTWMASKETDTSVTHPTTMIEEAGTFLKASMDVLKKYGAAPESNLPFHIQTNMYTGSENAFFATASTRRIGAYYNLFRDFNQWRTWLAAHGPLLVGLSVDATWDHATQTHGNLDTFQPNTVRGGHAVCVVGYTSSHRFIIRNSWGTSWGDQGFAYASEGYLTAGFYNESYGVTL